MADDIDDLLARGESGSKPPAAPVPKAGGDDLDDLLTRGETAPKVDMGPEARRARAVGGMRPEPKPDDDGEAIADYSKHDVRRTLQGINDKITTPEAREAQKASLQANDPIRNDPLAGMIVQSIPAAGMGAVAGGLTRYVAPGLSPLVQGATTGAASNPDAPVTGALLGAIPGIPGAARAADQAIGAKALAIAPEAGGPGLAGTLTKAGKAAGGAAGAAVGGKVAGFPGAAVGMGVGAKAGGAAGALAGGMADKAANALARRYLTQEAERELAKAAALPGAGAALSERAARYLGRLQAPEATATARALRTPEATGFSPNSPPIPPPRPRLAPLEHEPLPPPSEVPGGAPGTPFVDDFGVPVTEGGPVGHATVGGATAVEPRAMPRETPQAPVAAPAGRRLQILDENGRDLLGAAPEPPSLRSDVIRDAQRFAREPYDVAPAAKGRATPATASAGRPDLLYDSEPAAGGVEDQLTRSVRILGELKSAAAAGKLTPAMIQDAARAGMSPGAIAKVIGKDATTAVSSKAADAALARIAQTVRAGRIPSPAVVKQAIAAGAKQSTIDGLMRGVTGPAQAF